MGERISNFDVMEVANTELLACKLLRFLDEHKNVLCGYGQVYKHLYPGETGQVSVERMRPHLVDARRILAEGVNKIYTVLPNWGLIQTFNKPVGSWVTISRNDLEDWVNLDNPLNQLSLVFMRFKVSDDGQKMSGLGADHQRVLRELAMANYETVDYQILSGVDTRTWVACDQKSMINNLAKQKNKINAFIKGCNLPFEIVNQRGSGLRLALIHNGN